MPATIDPAAHPFPLHCAEITDGGAAPDRWMVILHGIYGRGGNWRAFARALAIRRPDWGFLLVDLRMHGRSQGAPGPHTLTACAQDVLALIDARRGEGQSVEAVLGHSFGGKVALEMLRQRATIGEVWVIDSAPGPHPEGVQDLDNTVVSVLRLLQELPELFTSRAEFVAEVTRRGFANTLADWLAMNLEPAGEQYRCTLDTSAMEELLVDYFQADLWPVLTEASGPPVRFAIATRSSSISEADQLRLAELEKTGHVVSTRVEGGHWLHVDAAPALADLVLSSLP